MAYPKPSKRKKPAKKKKGKSTTSRIHALVRKIVMARDQHCVICGSSENLEVSHYLGRAKMGVAFDLDNCHAMCRKCHRLHHDGSPIYMEWMRKEYGDGIFSDLYLKQQKWIESGGANEQIKDKIYHSLHEVWANVQEDIDE